MRPDRNRKRAGAGFTLIELLAVIMIAGLLAAVSVPTFNSILKGTALNTASNSLTNTLYLARQLAVTFRYVYHVEFDYGPLTAAESGDKIDDSLQKDRYRIYFVDREARNPQNPTESEKITVGKWRQLPRFVEFDPNSKPPEEILFRPSGDAREDTGSWPRNFRIIHTESGTSGKEKAIVIKVDGVTGRIKSEAEQK